MIVKCSEGGSRISAYRPESMSNNRSPKINHLFRINHSFKKIPKENWNNIYRYEVIQEQEKLIINTMGLSPFDLVNF